MGSLRLLEILTHPGPDSAVQLLERWYGPLKPEDGIPADRLAGIPMPAPLRDFYARAGRRFAGGQNEFLTPDGPDRRELWGVQQQQGDKLIFYIENQHVYEWATALDGDDPPVWYRSAGSETWNTEIAPLSIFLLQAVLLNLSLFHDPAGAWRDSKVAADELARLKAGLIEVPGGLFGPYSLRFFAGDDIVIQVDSANRAYIGASCGEALRPLSLDPESWNINWPPEGTDLDARLMVAVSRSDGRLEESEFWLAEDGTERRWEPVGEAVSVSPGDVVRVPHDQEIAVTDTGRLDAVLVYTRPSIRNHTYTHLNAGFRKRPLEGPPRSWWPPLAVYGTPQPDS